MPTFGHFIDSPSSGESGRGSDGVAGGLPDGRRDYKLAVKDPLPTSFGEDLYYRLGGWLEEAKPYP
jgi:hypothetical protein